MQRPAGRARSTERDDAAPGATVPRGRARPWPGRRAGGCVLVVLGEAIVVLDAVGHRVDLQWFALQDLVLGYPTGVVAVMVGAVLCTTASPASWRTGGGARIH